MNSIVSDQIVKLRKEKKLTQQDLADQMNVSTAAVCKWETGASIPDINTLCMLADYFNVSVDYILGREARTKKCVVFCSQKECEKVIKGCVEKQGLALQSYIESIIELEVYLERTLEFVPLVISFSTGKSVEVHTKKLEDLRSQYGFKLISIETSTVNEFEDALEIYLKNFK